MCDFLSVSDYWNCTDVFLYSVYFVPINEQCWLYSQTFGTADLWFYPCGSKPHTPDRYSLGRCTLNLCFQFHRWTTSILCVNVLSINSCSKSLIACPKSTYSWAIFMKSINTANHIILCLCMKTRHADSTMLFSRIPSCLSHLNFLWD